MKKKGRKIRKSVPVQAGKSKTYFIKDSNGRLEEELKFSLKTPSECENINLSESSLYYYQTENVMKIYLSLTGVQNISRSQIKINFSRKNLELAIYNLENVNYHLRLQNLINPIIPNKCKHLIRKDKVVIELAKEHPIFWRSLQEVVSKQEWMKAYAPLIADFMTFLDQAELCMFCENIWTKMAIIEERNYNSLKPPQKLSELIPALKENPSFKSHDSAINFYRHELKKNNTNDILYMVLGTCVLEKLILEKTALNNLEQAESIDDLPNSSPPPEAVLKKIKKKSVEKIAMQLKEQIPMKQLTEEEEMQKSAEAKKLDGNLYYKSGKFSMAIDAYQEAIRLWPKCPLYYTNCSASYIMIGNFTAGLKMAQKAIEIDGLFFKAHLRKAKCHIALGQTAQASKSLNKAKAIEPMNEELESAFLKNENLESHLTLGKDASAKSRYSQAAHHFEAATNIATGNSLILFQCVECFVLCDQFDKAKEKAGKLLLKNYDKDIAYCMLGMCAFFEDEKDRSFNFFKKALAVNPNHYKTQYLLKKVKDVYVLKESGNKSFGNHDLGEALKYYKKALKVEPRNKNICAKLYYNISMVKLKERKAREAIDCLTSAIKLKNDYVKAYLKRAELYKEQNKMIDAIHDYEQVCKLEPTETHEKLLQQARLTIRNNGMKDYYKVLGLDASASIDDIKKAYKKLALKHHPDKHEGSSEKKDNEDIFKEITEAYTVLKDPKLKYKYDHGSLSDDEMNVVDILKMQMFMGLFRRMFSNDDDDFYCSDDDNSWDSFDDEFLYQEDVFDSFRDFNTYSFGF